MSRRREGPLLALVTFAALAGIAALTIGAVAGVEQCGYVLFALIGVAAVVARAELAELTRRVWTGLFGGEGRAIAAGARVVWLVWGVLAVVAATAGLVASL